MSRLPKLVSDFVSAEFEADPLLATVVGAEGYDHRLPDFSAAGFERRDRDNRAWHKAFAATDDALDPEDAIDRDLALSALRGRILLADRPDWRRDPSVYVNSCVYAIYTLFVHRLRPEAELVGNAVARLRLIPDVLDEAMANLDAELAPALLVDRAKRTIRGAVSYLRDDVPDQTSDPQASTSLAAAGAHAAVALQRFEHWLEGFAQRATGDWRLGEPLYTALLAERELLDVDAAGLHARGQRAYDDISAQMTEVAARVPGGCTDWRAVMATLSADHPPTLEAMQEEYAAATTRARDFLAERTLVPFAPGEQCRVVPSPPFRRATAAVAAYLRPPALTDSRVGHFFVPYPEDGASPEQVEQRLQTNARASIPTITAHETYPGHHWHLSWSADRQRPLRAILGTPYFSEGWALYAEHLMHEHGFFSDPRTELGHLDARIFRAARIVVDTALHSGEMTVEQAVDVMSTRVSLSRGTAELEVQRYCAGPTQAAAYLTGGLQIERIRERWLGLHPGAPLADFHADLAGSGSLPLGLAARAVLGDTA